MEAVGAECLAGTNASVSAADKTRTSLARGAALFVVYFALYALTLIDAVAPLPVALNLLFAVANGILIAMLFILGHDCCHGTLVPNAKLNAWLGRIAFIPVLHSVSLWRDAHNRLHHGRTNLKGFDPVWAPMSVQEYANSSTPRRWLERIYRSPFGPIVYYLFAIWLPKLVFPFGKPATWKKHLPDTLFVLLGGALTISTVLLLGHWLAPARPPWLTFLLGWLLPFLVWNYFAAVTTYMNHTHPDIPWFANEAMWNSHAANIAGTVHVKIPLNILPLYTDVMAHTAHHARQAMPVYALAETQVALKQRFAADVKEYVFSIREYRRICAACKLFDFETMRWTDFDGTPTSQPLLSEKSRGINPVSSL